MILMAAEACVSLKFAGILGNRDFWIILIGLITTVNALLKHNHLKWFQIFTVGATLILSIIMTYAVLSTVNVADLMDKKPKGHLTFSLGLDYVIGMCLSWVPLVADYSRYARNINGAAHATYWGYALSSIWMYFVGLLCTIATGLWNASPIPIMGALGLGIPGLLIIFFHCNDSFSRCFFSRCFCKQFISKVFGEASCIHCRSVRHTDFAGVSN